MADFDLALAITADGSDAVAETNKVGGAIEDMSQEVAKAEAAALKLEIAQAKAAQAAAGLAIAEERVAAAATKSATAQSKAAADLAVAKARLSVANEQLRKTQSAVSGGAVDVARSMQKQGYAIRNTGQQVGDFVTQGLAPGIGFMRSFAQQAGQMGYALSEFQSGPLKRVGDFLVGPWGIALTVGALAVVAFAEAFDRSSAAAEKTAKANGLVKMTTEDLIKAIDELAKAQDKANKSAREGKVDAMAHAAALYIMADAARAAAIEQLQLAKAQLENTMSTPVMAGDEGAAGIAMGVTARRVKTLTDEVDRLSKSTENARVRFRNAQTDLAEYNLTTEAAKKAGDAYTETLSKIRAEFAKDKDPEKRDAAIIKAKATLEAVENAERNAKDATREHNKELREQAKAAREAAKEQEKLLKLLDRLDDRYNGAGKAGNQLTEDLAEIARLSSPRIGKGGLVSSGPLDQATGVGYSAQINGEMAKQQQAASKALFQGMFPDVPSLREQIEAAERLKTAEQELADIRLKDALAGIDALGDAMADIFGIKGAGGLGQLAKQTFGKRNGDGNTDQEQKYIDGINKLGEGVGIKPEDLGKFSKVAGKAFAGAQTGELTNQVFKPLADALGVKTSKTGAKIGGAIGGATGLPGGDIVGAIIGSVIGGAFKKTKYGGVTLTSAEETGTSFGNSGKAQEVAEGFAGVIQDGLKQIADQLGGGLGAFNLTVGTRHGDYRVNTGGTSLKKNKGAQDFDDDAEAAAAYAIAQAIAQGAITGLSAAVQKAIQSTPDINEAVAEALKVQEIEEILSDVGGALDKTFRTLEKQLGERVRIAREYGFDLVKLEEENQKERLAAVEAIVSERVGALQDLLRDITFGDLFEGSATDRRDAILGEIAKQRDLANSGDAEAGKQLADLYRQLLETSRDAFGTASGAFTTDRGTVTSGAAAVIEAQRRKVEEAAQQQRELVDANKAQAVLANETNNLLSQAVTGIGNVETLLAQINAAGGIAAFGGFDITGRPVSV